MSNFMPVNEASAQALNERLAETIFKSAPDFVNFYNSGLINQKNEEVKKIAAELTAVFKDVRERGGKLVFISQQEVHLNEIMDALAPWEILVKAKREAESAVAEGSITADTVLAFSKKNNGFILKTEDEEGVTVLTKIGNDKLFNKFEDVAPIFDRGIIDGERDGDTYLFHAQELLELDSSFISQIRTVIPA